MARAPACGGPGRHQPRPRGKPLIIGTACLRALADGLKPHSNLFHPYLNMTTKIAYVLNGPNLNLLGTREPAVYGAATLADVEQLCVAASEQHSLGLVFRQSNHEGDLVDWIHEAGRLHAQGQLAGLIINAGAYTHTSVALQDAIKGTGITCIELHISNVFAREAFRHHSYISPVAKAVMCGFGVKGYPLALAALAEMSV